MSDAIKLSSLLQIKNPHDYKIHFAMWNGNVQPLDEFVRGMKYWRGWNEWKPKSNAFNRQYIFSVMDYYPEANRWIFGGIWEVLERDLAVKRHYGYKIKACDLGVHTSS